MKLHRLIVVSIVLSGILVDARSQAVWDSSNVGGTFNVNDVTMTSATIGFAVGDSGAIAKTTNGGKTWATQSIDPLRSLMAVSFQDSVRGCTAGTGTCRYTTNGGTTWLTPSTTSFVGTKSLAWGAPNTCIGVGTGGQIMRTTNGGATWTIVVMTTSQSLYGVAFCDSSRAVAVGNVKIVRSTDGGLTWPLAWSPSGFLWDVTSPAAHRFVAVGYKSSPVRGVVYRSSDDGNTWDSLIVSTTAQLRSVSFASPDTGFALSAAGTVFLTTNGGSVWDSVSVLPVATAMGSIAVADTKTMLVSNDRGNVFRMSRGATDVAPRQGVPSMITLDHNYPNPFNPSTTIRYGLPSRSHVSVTVFNMVGQQVSILQNGEQEAGYHEVKFDAKSLPSGVYFYRMQAGSHMETKKLLLVR